MTEQTDTRLTLDAGGRAIQKVVVASTLLVAAASFVMGVPALYWAAELAGLGITAWLAPLVVDAGLTAAGLAAAVRHSQKRHARLETALMIGLTLLSMSVQIIHALKGGGVIGEAIVAAAVAAAAPLTVLVATHVALRAVLSEPTSTTGRRSCQAGRATGRTTAGATGPAAITTTSPTSPAHPRPRAVDTAPSRHTPSEPTAELDAVLPQVLSGQLSLRKAARDAGVSYHKVRRAVDAAGGVRAGA